MKNVDLIEENNNEDETSGNAYKITLMKLPNKCKHLFENEVKLVIEKKKKITIGEFVHYINDDKVDYDIMKGVFSDYIIKNCINIYLVFEIEYDNFNLIENYNYQRRKISYYNIMNDNLSDLIKKFGDCPDACVHFLVGGTQTNETVITAALRSHQGVIAAETGHINVHETGAIESCGHKVLALKTEDGKTSLSYDFHEDNSQGYYVQVFKDVILFNGANHRETGQRML